MPSRTPKRRLSEYADEQDLAAFWNEVEPRREPSRWSWFLPLVLLLVVLSVPWYLPASLVGGVLLGLPIWTWIALLCSAGIAALTSWAALRHWHDDVE